MKITRITKTKYKINGEIIQVRTKKERLHPVRSAIAAYINSGEGNLNKEQRDNMIARLINNNIDLIETIEQQTIMTRL